MRIWYIVINHEIQIILYRIKKQLRTYFAIMETNIDLNLINNFFGLFSVRTWLLLKLVKNGKFRLNETTITQNLVKDFWIESQLYEFPIKIYESTNERVNGNDLEILLETTHGYIMLPVQIKVIKDDDRYPGISYTVRGLKQIDLLIDYANKKQGIPAYIFYNYYNDIDFDYYVTDYFSQCKIEEFGCTIGNATNIRNAFFERGGLRQWRIPSFEDLHMPAKFAIPLHLAFCKLIDGKDIDIIWFLGKHNQSRKIHFFSFEELKQDEFWHELFPPGRISGISGTPLIGDPIQDTITDSLRFRNTKSAIHDEPHLFSPQYRIVISKRRLHTYLKIQS